MCVHHICYEAYTQINVNRNGSNVAFNRPTVRATRNKVQVFYIEIIIIENEQLRPVGFNFKRLDILRYALSAVMSNLSQLCIIMCDVWLSVLCVASSYGVGEY